jgi:metallo-beta-lactamase family protein
MIRTCTARHLLPDGELRLLGAVDKVTPSMHWVTMGKSSFLVDCGLARFHDPIPKEALKADTLLLTHAHNDHLSGLFRLMFEGRMRRVVATAPTLDIARIQVRDGLYLSGGAKRDFQRFEKRLAEIAMPATYGAMLSNVTGEVDAIFHEAGHLLGSASIELCSSKSRVILSGDLGRPGSPILRDYNTTWADDRPVDLVLMETTYGDRDQEAEATDLVDALERAVNRALKDGGHIIVPTFAVGRTQVLLYLLNELVEAKRIPEIPVAVDTPMGLSVTKTYKRFEKLYDRDYLRKLEAGDDPLDFDNLFAVHRASDSYRIDTLEHPMLILSASGMCTAGRILHHLEALLPKPETDVIFVGWQAPGSHGYEIQHIEERDRDPSNPPEVILNGRPVPVRAHITTLKGVSAHADRRELAHWFSCIPQVRTLALNHGDREAQEGVARLLNDNVLDRHDADGKKQDAGG